MRIRVDNGKLAVYRATIRPPRLNDLVQKVATYLSDSTWESKFLDAYAFLVFTGLGSKLTVYLDAIMPDEVTDEIISYFYPKPPKGKIKAQLKQSILKSNEAIIKLFAYKWETGNTLHADLVCRNLPIREAVDQAFLKQANLHLKNFAYGLGLWLLQVRQLREVAVLTETTKTGIITRIWIVHKGSYTAGLQVQRWIDKYKLYIPNLRQVLLEKGYIKEGKPLIGEKFIYPVKPLKEIWEAIKQIVAANRLCPVCGKLIKTAKIRKDSKICLKCRKRVTDLKNDALKANIHQTSHTKEEFMAQLQALKKQKDLWLIKRKRKPWKVHNWPALAEIILGRLGVSLPSEKDMEREREAERLARQIAGRD